MGLLDPRLFGLHTNSLPDASPRAGPETPMEKAYSNYLKGTAMGRQPEWRGYSAQFATPQSAITGKPLPTTEEKFYLGKALANYLATNLLGPAMMGKDPHYRWHDPDRVSGREEARLYSEPVRIEDFTYGEVDPPGIGGIRKGAKAIAKGQKPVSASFKPGPGFKTAAEPLNSNTLPDVDFGDLKPFEAFKIKPETRKVFGENLDQMSKFQLNWYDKHRGESAIHYNTKTGLSIDFSTSCPKRLDNLTGPCPYCYVEHGRVVDKMFNMKGSNKGIFEQPYEGQVMNWNDNFIREMNKDGGIRMFSFGDYRPVDDYENVKRLLFDANRRGLIVKAITKQPEFVKTWGRHPNLRINISIDNVPRDISANAPTKAEALKLLEGHDNIAIRAVALNREEAMKFARDGDIDVVTLYHGLTNFTTSKFDYIKSGPLYDEMFELFNKVGLDETKRLYPEYNIRYLQGKELTKKEIEKGATYRFEIKRSLHLAEDGRKNDKGQKLYRHDKIFKVVKDQNPQLVERLGGKRVRNYLDTWENMPYSSDFAVEMQKSNPGRICCQGGKCAKDKTKCGFGLGAMLLPGVIIPDYEE